MGSSFRHQRPLVIEWGDCDPAGIVFYPRYFAMFDASTWDLLRAALGMPARSLLDRYAIVGCPMVDTRAVFHGPLSHGERATITSRIETLGRSSLKVVHHLHRDDGALAVECWETRVWAAPHPEIAGRIAGVAIPDDVRAALLGPISGDQI